MTEKHVHTWVAAWRQAVLDHLPRNREDEPWLWILAAQTQADPSLARCNEGNSRYLDDIEGILRVSGPELDLAYIHREAARIGVFGVWRELLERSNLRRQRVTSGGG